MTKKSIIFSGIFFVIAVAVAGGVLWYANLVQRDAHLAQQKAEEEQKKLAESNKEKSENDLVWYEVPELGVKFLTSMDAKDDLHYSARERTIGDEKVRVGVVDTGFTSLIETKGDQNKNCILSEDGYSCGRFFLYDYKLIDNQNLNDKTLSQICTDSNGIILLKKNENEIICYYGDENLVITDQNYRDWFHVPSEQKDKWFKVSFQSIKWADD